ncbi:alpha-glucosidase maltase [Aspergillus pseudoviridinutans]|uniref:alpha-galactosidase n=1 Tax=Aspergillus pseudoviridinutans TaxID=1517512 RepID=A0A9P3F1A8_9EURO|nr:alpha-glucosidase maltase [Aspergillus pseudoviridinutans]GIJ92710.1 alpha-glucosidase maltase [Aspergillus pseudoviridinutans]
MTAANEIVNLGMKDLGYEYVNKRIIPDAKKFPGGISGLADQVHRLGLKIGAGETTCAGYPASLGYEQVDAAAFAEWRIDYLKYDNFGVPRNWTDQYAVCDDGSGDSVNALVLAFRTQRPLGTIGLKSDTFTLYTRMRDALK